MTCTLIYNPFYFNKNVRQKYHYTIIDEFISNIKILLLFNNGMGFYLKYIYIQINV